MPASMSQLLGDRARVTITGANGFSIFVDYRPQVITTKSMRADLHRAASGADSINTEALEAAEDEAAALAAAEAAIDKADDLLARRLAEKILDWDLLDDAGAVVPITYEALQGVDLRLLKRIDRAIDEDSTVGESNGARSLTLSPSRSSRKARRATSRR